MTDAATRFEPEPSAMAPVPYLVRDRVVENRDSVDPMFEATARLTPDTTAR